ncbi:MAG: hypothetical protein NC395_01735 [Prevotella sp.]|nr:hypothetical protein [Prevotella sp.]
MKLAEKFGGIFRRDKFEAGFRNALKRRQFTVVSKPDDNKYEVSNGTVVFTVDVSEARAAYEQSRSDEELDRLINRLEHDCLTKGRMVSFTNGQEFLRLLMMREKDVTADMICADFVEGLKKVAVYTPDDEIIHFLDEDTLKRWGVPREVIFSVADRNMCRILSKAEINEESLGKDIKALEIKISAPAFCSSLIMCNEFRPTVYEKLGAKFLVVAPSRENLLVLKNITNNILEGLGTAILSEYRKAKNPLTTDVLLFTPQEIQVAGRFSVGRDEDSRSTERPSVPPEENTDTVSGGAVSAAH